MMKILIDLGMQFPKDTSTRKRHMAIFECSSCFKEVRADTLSVKRNDQNNCQSCSKAKHGYHKNTHYDRYCKIIDRCCNEKSKDYFKYGGRGITICDEWKNIDNFIKWAEETYIDGTTIDRKDNEKGYNPDNCRWTTYEVQAQNRRKSSRNTSGFKGVYVENRKNPFRARITLSGKIIALGSYHTAIEAAKAYDIFAIKNKTEHLLNGVLTEDEIKNIQTCI